MATIEKGRELMTLVNVFTVSPDKQAELADLLIRATEETMRHLRSQADFAALKDNPKARPHMQAAAALATFEPIVCEVVDSVATDE